MECLICLFISVLTKKEDMASETTSTAKGNLKKSLSTYMVLRTLRLWVQASPKKASAQGF